MGKVGSSSILLSLRSQDHFVFHCHRLDINVLNATRDIPEHKEPLWLYNNVVKKRKPAKYITLARDPISVNVSSFFQNLDQRTRCQNAHETMTPDELTEIFEEKYSDFKIPLTWFDQEIAVVLDIDVYEYPFPHEKGYQRINKEHIDLLIIRTEAADSVKENAIAEFLGLDSFTLTSANVGEKKDYGNLYKEFKRTITFPPDAIDMYYSAQYTRHFYTPEEIKGLRERWSSQP